jgi:hypothetical protein
MGVRKISQALYGGKNDVMGAAAHFSGLVQDVGNGGGGNACGLGNITNG